MPQQAAVFDSGQAPYGELDYLLFLPPGHQPDGEHRWPLILFLHGAGERGRNLTLIRHYGIPRVADANPAFPFIAVSPQCPAGAWWDDYIETLGALVDHAIGDYAVDPDRVYLTGLSMGGYGAWHLGTTYPERFAALAPICGGGSPAFGFPARVCALRAVPVWAFHGALDDVVPLAESVRMVETLQACGGNARLTVYPDLAHDSWTRAYGDSQLYDWFLAQRRSRPGPDAMP